jgi:hypothetical protein
VVALVDDNTPTIWRIAFEQVLTPSALDAGEEVIERRGAITSGHQLAERFVAEHVPERIQRLSEDLFAMGQEQHWGQSVDADLALVVEGRHDRLAGPVAATTRLRRLVERALGLELIENLAWNGNGAKVK